MALPKLTRGAWHDCRVCYADRAGYPIFAFGDTSQEADRIVEVFNAFAELHAALKVATRNWKGGPGFVAHTTKERIAILEALRHADTVVAGTPRVQRLKS